MLFTRHDDRPGVVGALGGILGREGINISRMEVASEAGQSNAMALIGISAPLSALAMAEIGALEVIKQVIQVEL